MSPQDRDGKGTEGRGSGHKGPNEKTSDVFEEKVSGEVVLTIEEQAARRALRELPEPEARSVFRERLRTEFVERRVPSSTRTPSFSWKRILWGLALPAAAALTALILLTANRGPDWRLMDPTVAGTITLDGRTVSLSEAGPVLRRLKAGARITYQDSSLVILSSPGNLALQLLPGTEMTLPAVPGRWFNRAVRGTVEHGEVRIATDQKFHGALLVMATPEVEVEVRGTTVAVLRPPFGTCVCVFEGNVVVSAPGAAPEAVSPGGRFTIFSEGQKVDRGEILPEERVKLGMLQEMVRGSGE